MIVVRLRAGQVARWSVFAGLALVALHSVVAVLALTGMLPLPSRLQGLVSLRGELNLPAWFSAMQLLLAAGLATVVARRDHGPLNARGSGWYTLAGLVALHAVDEVSGFHERLAASVPSIAGGPTSAQQWLLVGGAFALGFLGWFAPLLRRMHPEPRRAFLLAGLLYYGGAVVLNAMGVLVATGGHSTRFLAISTLEETAELLGVSALLYAIVRQQEVTTTSSDLMA